ncbi:hypothetical protein CcI49_15915 [Frankia sp. CcI49]|uniref:hypothetical protein n=1 Tax=Frankia sp. CcI49 TaxID=1745382 RepID=UPI000975E7D4|nr:hypothetical protein [Frankia sp. CcI49]ONH59694.1 hypothetical protein CcI49_15915 [Frankia sp. CcI49]
MVTTTWMWEARAAEGRLADLEAWALGAARDQEAEIYLGREASAGLVVILLHVGGGGPEADTVGPPLPDPPVGLVTGTVHAWQFERADSRLDRSDRLG